MTNPRLGAQVDHPLELAAGEQVCHGIPICQLPLFEVEVGEGEQPGQSRLFQAYLVVVVQIIQPHHLMACLA